MSIATMHGHCNGMYDVCVQKQLGFTNAIIKGC